MKKTTKSSAKTAKPARLKKAATKSPLKKSANRLTKSVTTTKKAPVAKKMLSKVRPALKTPVAKKTIIKKYVKPSSQYDMVLKHLMKKGSINVLEAIELYGVLRLGALVFDLKKGGMNIETSVHSFVNKSGRTSKIAKYILRS